LVSVFSKRSAKLGRALSVVLSEEFALETNFWAVLV